MLLRLKCGIKKIKIKKILLILPVLPYCYLQNCSVAIFKPLHYKMTKLHQSPKLSHAVADACEASKDLTGEKKWWIITI